MSAPVVAVRPQRPWYVRAVAVVFVLSLAGVAIWVIDPSAHLAALRRADELRALQSANAALEEEVTRLRGLLAARENDLQIERAAQQSLSDKHKALIDENARLKEELVVLQRLASKARKK